MSASPAITPVNLDLTRDALASSTLSHGLQVLGDRWTVSVLLGAFLGFYRFDDWRLRLGLPRQTLTQRLKALVALGLLRQRPYQEKPQRLGYHLTQTGLALYSHVLMIWAWERRWGTRELALPAQLVHRPCGHAFVPHMACRHCAAPTGASDLSFSLQVNPALMPDSTLRQRTPRLSAQEGPQMGLGLRVDRWALLIVTAVFLGCHYFDQLAHVLGIGSSVLARRLNGMVDDGLLLCQVDLTDTRRRIYRLTPASHDLFGYILCFSSWASRHHFEQPSSIRPVHKDCGQAFVPQAVCSHCQAELLAHEVDFVLDEPLTAA